MWKVFRFLSSAHLCGIFKYKSRWCNIDAIVREVNGLVEVIFQGQNIILVSSTLAIIFGGLKWTTKKINKKQDDMIVQLDKRLDDIEREQLRTQILTGIDSHRFSKSEVLYFFDKYKNLNGNSFVDDKVNEYVRNLDKENYDV